MTTRQAFHRQDIKVRVIVGPCPCQGCGQEVIYVRQGLARGWLHASGNLWCHKRRAVEC